MSMALFELSDFAEPKVYTGVAPLGFTQDYFHPDDLVEADRWLRIEEGLNFGSAAGRIHTWRLGMTTGWAVPEGAAEHSCCILTCCLGCFDYPTHDFDRSGEWWPGKRLYTCSCVRGDLYQAVCADCRWHVIAEDEQSVVEAWHDHAFPGWRDLPVVPIDVAPRGGGMFVPRAVDKKAAKRAAAWVEEHYPAGWGRPFAPVLTERGGYGTRAVPGYSPWQGFDICGRVTEGGAS